MAFDGMADGMPFGVYTIWMNIKRSEKFRFKQMKNYLILETHEISHARDLIETPLIFWLYQF